MEEYEYSFKVSSIKPFINYCERNDYEKGNIEKQHRIVYENKYSKDIIARITTNQIGKKKQTVFDCKNVGERNKELKISSESIPMMITNKNKKEIESVLEVLNFYIAADLYRTRYIYIKDGVKFEIDEYISPEMKVVAIEGNRKSVDKIYKEIESLFKR